MFSVQVKVQLDFFEQKISKFFIFAHFLISFKVKVVRVCYFPSFSPASSSSPSQPPSSSSVFTVRPPLQLLERFLFNWETLVTCHDAKQICQLVEVGNSKVWTQAIKQTNLTAFTSLKITWKNLQHFQNVELKLPPPGLTRT